MANLKFYKMAQAPVGTEDKPLGKGAVWFDSTNGLIHVYNGSTWDAYVGVRDAVVDGEKLTITKRNGSTVSVDFSKYATDEALGLLDTRVETLETTVAGHGESISGLSGRMTTVENKAKANEDKLAGLSKNTVMAEIEAQVAAEAAIARKAEGDLAARVTPLETASADYAERIGALEGFISGGEEGESVQDLIDAAITKNNTDVVTPGLATKTDLEAFNKYKTDNDAEVAAVKKTAEDEVTRATAAEKLINEKFGAEYSKDNTVAASIAAAQKAADDARAIIDEFLSEEGISDEAVNSLKEIVDYMNEHGEDYQAVVDNLDTLNTDVAALQGKVDVEKVSTAIATAKGEAVTAANGYADGLIAAEVERAEAAYEKIGVAAGLVNGLAEGAVAANATAISGLQGQVGTGTVDSRIATAKSEAITAAGETADQKIADLKLDETYEKVGVAQGLVNALATGAVASNTTEITNLKAALEKGDGLTWAQFE